MNFIFISPNFPKTYFHFTAALKQNGVTTLGIGDEPYEQLSFECKQSLTEYYKVNNLEDYQEVYRAIGYFIHHYGRIDWLESNNEYWLERDAQLRTDFNIKSGIQTDKISGIKYKSKMKAFYQSANVPTARYHLVTTYENALLFIKEVGYPVVVKPDNGVGAEATYKLNNNRELKKFMDCRWQVPYIMEEFIDGSIISYDGVADAHKNVIFETSHIFPDQIMDLVNKQKDTWYYSALTLPNDLQAMGRAVIQAFDSASRFFHCEFFRLNKDKPGLGKKGDLVGLEVNMRPAGGYTCDMMNFAFDTNVYQIWADMIAFDESKQVIKQRHCCVYAARRDAHRYLMSDDTLLKRYQENLCMVERMPDIFATAMGNDAYMARFDTEAEAIQFATAVLQKRA